MKRALAVLGAIVMIGVSVAIRHNIDSDSKSAASGPLTIACITELADACNAMSNVTVRVEDASVTAKAIADGQTDIDGWVTFDPWPTMAAVLAQHDVVRKSTPVASSPLAIAMVRERAAALAPLCGGQVNWKCLGDNAGKQWSELGGKPEWGTLKVGLPSASSASGSLLLADAATSYFGRTAFATNDFDDLFRVWRTNLVATPGTFTDFIQFFPAKFSAVGAIRAVADPGTREVDLIDQSASAVVVLADLTGRTRTSDLQRILIAGGWTDPGASGLPDPGVLLALSGLTK